jgi:hypothetical protein
LRTLTNVLVFDLKMLTPSAIAPSAVEFGEIVTVATLPVEQVAPVTVPLAQYVNVVVAVLPDTVGVNVNVPLWFRMTVPLLAEGAASKLTP